MEAATDTVELTDEFEPPASKRAIRNNSALHIKITYNGANFPEEEEEEKEDGCSSP